jgi:hypothetical protein
MGRIPRNLGVLGSIAIAAGLVLTIINLRLGCAGDAGLLREVEAMQIWRGH